MCANDIAVLGAEALFFLDYYASGRLQVDQAQRVIEGIARGCSLAGCALIGGETAEMPGIYREGDFDLAGFCVGIVDRTSVIDGSSVAAGNRLLALASSGPHSNGYSLIRKLIETTGADLAAPCGEQTLADALMAPTRIYVKNLLALAADHRPLAIAHITGGGLSENIPRVLPAGLAARIELSSWRRPPVFEWLQQAGNIVDSEMLRTFNCGVGMVLAVDAGHEQACLERLAELGETAWSIGEVIERDGGPAVQFV